MDVSVVIVTRNTRELTLAAVASVGASEGDFTREVIVVDNGSTDGTGEAIRAQFPRVLYEGLSRNLGFAGANNLGARRAAGEFLLLLNSDARLQPGSLAAALAWMRANPSCGLAGAQLLNPDGTRQNSIANDPTLATELLNKSLLRRMQPARYPGKERLPPGPTDVESVIGAFFLTRRSLWNQLGGLDERYFFFFEETDYCLRVRRAGLRVVHLPSVLVWHAQGQSAGRRPAAARIEYYRSRYAFFEVHRGPAARWILAAGLLARLAAGVALNGLGVAATAGMWTRLRLRFAVQARLLAWHARGRPASWGLPR